MPRATINGIGIQYEAQGKPEKGSVMLVSGLGMQLTQWSESFVRLLVSRGYRVVRMDNRDSGLSQSIDRAGVPGLAEMLATRRVGCLPNVPYTLDDMAADTAGLIELLELGRVHVVGASMGGMIAQLLALNHEKRVASLVSIMSTTGNPSLPGPTPEAQALLTAKRTSPAVDREHYLDEAVASSVLLSGSRWPETPAQLRARAIVALDRSYRPLGFLRQYAAIIAAEDRSQRLRGLVIPAAVIHGTEDPLVRVEAGRDTANCISGCEFIEIEGMGHSIPPEAEELVVETIDRTASRAVTPDWSSRQASFTLNLRDATRPV